ncbi:uncharacterized protein LOC106636700 [Copidosoma floridanum]|uniref:uncharacterized protein LOC106636700 n=1 Tax=Copidosoma floridanum TaxID=29053 RepID=UPI0006C947B6|nr:uncharacterized protein LOC106636700 [Copidosoma floridanum]
MSIKDRTRYGTSVLHFSKTRRNNFKFDKRTMKNQHTVYDDSVTSGPYDVDDKKYQEDEESTFNHKYKVDQTQIDDSSTMIPHVKFSVKYSIQVHNNKNKLLASST